MLIKTLNAWGEMKTSTTLTANAVAHIFIAVVSGCNVP